MTKPRRLKFKDSGYRSPKRRKLASGSTTKYSTRVISWEEQLQLPKGFHEEEGVWPVSSILNERGAASRREYLLEWEPHPNTGEVFEPTWVSESNVGAELLETWRSASKIQSSDREEIPRSPEPRAASHTNTLDGLTAETRVGQHRKRRRVIEDSSSDLLSEIGVADSPTPTLASSPSSSIREPCESNTPAIEILETQQPWKRRSISVNIPTTGINKTEYDSIQGSQYSLIDSSSEDISYSFTASFPDDLPDSRSLSIQARASSISIAHKNLSEIIESPCFETQTSRSTHSAIPHPEQIDSSSIWGFQTQDLGRIDDIDSTGSYIVGDQAIHSGKKLSQVEGSADLSEAIAAQGSNIQCSSTDSRAQKTAMSGPVTRQSPRPRQAIPVSNIHTAVSSAKDRIRRPRTTQEPALANSTVPSQGLLSPQSGTAAGSRTISDQGVGIHRMQRTESMNVDQPEIDIPQTTRASILTDDTATEPSLPIQQSIEEEPMSSAEERNSIASKASSSQQSLENERLVPQIDGITLPVRPILGPAEFTIALPAEGKVQSTYTDTIKAKKKTVLKFINRRDSVGSANSSTTRTVERNEMIEMIHRLHDTTTHLDLGLPGFATQCSIRSEEASTYADYAGSKFAFLGHLVDVLSRVDCSMVIAAQSGPVQDLLEEYLVMKHVSVRRHDRPATLKPAKLDPSQVLVRVDLVSTAPMSELDLNSRPLMIIAFDSTFDNQESHINRIRELNSTGRNHPLPVVHLLITNSSEHIDRCLRKSMPSPQRLKLLVRGVYQARKFLGGQPTYVPHPSDEPEGRSMDLLDLQRAVRKSPERKLAMVANIVARAAITEDFDNHWTFSEMPDVQYAELDENMPKLSQTSTAVHSAVPTPRGGRARSRTPTSRAGTPSAKKRLLEVESAVPSLVKRQRLTPLRDTEPSHEPPVEQRSEIEVLRHTLKQVQGELEAERAAREEAVQAQLYAQSRLDEMTSSLADLQRRYEKRMKKTHELDKINKALTLTIENGKRRQEKISKDTLILKGQLSQLQSELLAARSDLKAEGGDITALELAREEARVATAKSEVGEKSLENMKRDFEFTRQQYQQASNRAAELGVQNSDLEAEVAELKVQAGEEKRKLKQMSVEESNKHHMDKIVQLELEKKRHLMLLRKMEEEIKSLKKNRGVQTRGSSVQPGSPGQRSRQGSPATGMLLPPSAHSGNRASVLRHER